MQLDPQPGPTMATGARPATLESGAPSDHGDPGNAATGEPPLARPPFSVAGKRLHLVGVGGCGMSGLARMLRDRGGLITGSDMQASGVTRALESEGFSIEVDEVGAPPEGTDLVVVSAAVKPDHPALAAAARIGAPS